MMIPFCVQDYYRRSHVPAFGSWDWNNDLPFTQCFETARQTGLLRYSYAEDRDLYVAGDLYENDVVTPAMIVVPRKKVRQLRAKQLLFFFFFIKIFTSFDAYERHLISSKCVELYKKCSK